MSLLLKVRRLFASLFSANESKHPSHHGAHHGQHRHHHASGRGRFANAEESALILDDPERDGWQKPDQVLAALELPDHGLVAEIGGGTGYFPVRIARKHPDATVYGVDVEPDMVRYLGERAKKEGFTNIHPVLGTGEDPKLPKPVDRILLVNAYHHLDDRPAYFRRLASSLRPGGRLIVIDYLRDSPIGPPAEMKLDAEEIIDELTAASYRLRSREDLPHQYLLVFEPR